MMGGDIIAAIAKWVVIGLLIAGTLYFIYTKMVRGAIAEDDLDETAEAEKENQDAREHLRESRRRLRDLWRRGRLRDR